MGPVEGTGKYEWEILYKNHELNSAGWWLTFWAGAINALTTSSVLFMRSTHMSGRVTDQAIYLLTNNVAMALFVSVVVLGFVAGAYYGAKAFPRLGISCSLLIPALLKLPAAGLVYLGFSASGPQGVETGRYLLGLLLPFAAGWQNSVTSQVGIGRTTHLTGDLTDLGIALATGNRGRAAYILIKYSGFVFGSVLGYLGGQSAPVITMAGIAAGQALTVVVFHVKNQSSLRLAGKE